MLIIQTHNDDWMAVCGMTCLKMARNYEILYRWRSVMTRFTIRVDAAGSSNLPTRVANDAEIILDHWIHETKHVASTSVQSRIFLSPTGRCTFSIAYLSCLSYFFLLNTITCCNSAFFEILHSYGSESYFYICLPKINVFFFNRRIKKNLFKSKKT